MDHIWNIYGTHMEYQRHHDDIMVLLPENDC